jgi:RHS repeat-associated protein
LAYIIVNTSVNHTVSILLPNGISIDIERDGMHREEERNYRIPSARPSRLNRGLDLLMAFDSRYDGMGRLKTHKLQIQLKEISSRAYTHDGDGRLVGIDDVPQNYYFQYAYSGAGRLTSSRHQIRAWLDEHEYHFDPAGNRIDKAKADSPIEDWQRVVQEHMGDPHFDMLGYVESHKNRPQVPMYEDNRVTEFEGTKNTYDAAGCLIEQIRPDKTRLKLHYDGAYRLVYIEKTNPDGKQTKISYAYDAISRRVFKGVTEEGKPQEVTRYGWDGDRCVYEETADQKITILYLPGTFSPFARIVQKIYPAPESDDPERDKAVDDAWKMVEKIMGRPLKKPQVPEKELEVQFFIPDHAGTPLFLVDAKGEVLWEALPDDWKATQEVELVKLLVSEYGVRQFIRFQGQWADLETGFYYNRHRFYDPAMGRYITQDPIGFQGGMNLYAYAGGDPVNYVDPHGLILPLLAAAAVFVVKAVTMAATAYAAYETAKFAYRALTCPGSLTKEDFFEHGGPIGALAGAVYNTGEGNWGTAALFAASVIPVGRAAKWGAKSKAQQEAARLEGARKRAEREERKRKLQAQNTGGNEFSRGGPPRDPKTKQYVPSAEAEGRPHTTLGARRGSDGKDYTQGATFGNDGKYLGRTDVTDHSRPSEHPNPHFHSWNPERGRHDGPVVPHTTLLNLD